MIHRSLIRCLILMAICLGLTSSVLAQSAGEDTDFANAKISATVSKTSIQIAEPFLLQVKCVAPAGAKVNFPAVVENLGKFEVVDHQDIFDVPVGDSSDLRSWTRNMTLESIVTGDLDVPPIEIQISDGSKTKRLVTDSVSVRIQSVLEDRPDPRNLRDVRPLVDVETVEDKSYAWAGWTLGGLAGSSILAWGIVALIRRKQFKTPLQWALAELDRLANAVEANSMAPNKSDSAQNGSTTAEVFPGELTLILREFLDLQLDISAPTQTTDEVLKLIQSTGVIDEAVFLKIGQLFALADQAKYAGLKLSDAQLQDAINEGRAIVKQIAECSSNAPTLYSNSA